MRLIIILDTKTLLESNHPYYYERICRQSWWRFPRKPRKVRLRVNRIIFVEAKAEDNCDEKAGVG